MDRFRSRAKTQTKESTDVNRGRAALAAYVKSAGLDRVEAQQDYTITDAIVSLMKLARDQGFDSRSLHRSALNHFDAEEPLLWIRQADAGFRASWIHRFGTDVFSIRCHRRKAVLTCRSGTAQVGTVLCIGEYECVTRAKADAQKLKGGVVSVQCSKVVSF